MRIRSSDDVFQEGVLGGHQSPPTPWHVDRSLGHPKTGTPVISTRVPFSKVFAIIYRTNFKECTAASNSSGIYVPHFFQHFRSSRLARVIFHHRRAFFRTSAENDLCIFGDVISIFRTQALWGFSAVRRRSLRYGWLYVHLRDWIVKRKIEKRLQRRRHGAAGFPPTRDIGF